MTSWWMQERAAEALWRDRLASSSLRTGSLGQSVSGFSPSGYRGSSPFTVTAQIARGRARHTQERKDEMLGAHVFLT
jgi:hypothetical protein